jgi:hypothetical protein
MSKTGPADSKRRPRGALAGCGTAGDLPPLAACGLRLLVTELTTLANPALRKTLHSGSRCRASTAGGTSIRFLVAIGFIAVVGAGAAGIFFFAGFYSVAATEKDPGGRPRISQALHALRSLQMPLIDGP